MNILILEEANDVFIKPFYLLQTRESVSLPVASALSRNRSNHFYMVREVPRFRSTFWMADILWWRPEYVVNIADWEVWVDFNKYLLGKGRD